MSPVRENFLWINTNRFKSQKSSNSYSERATNENFKLTHYFIDANIPLYKLNHQSSRSLFVEISNPLSSESTCRRAVADIAKSVEEKVHSILRDQNFFLVVDETDINGKKFVNILAGLLTEPSKTYLLDCVPIFSSPNAPLISQLVDETIKNIGVNRNHFLLEISDTASYMILAGKMLKNFYPKLFHLLCLAHLLHDCVLKIKTNFKEVDELIARVKAATIKKDA